MKNYIIILAAGKGNRLGAEMAKQFLPLNGKPILMHTIDQFIDNVYHNFEIILVLNKDDLQIWEDFCEQFHYRHSIRIVMGGKERFHSVKNALETIEDRHCYIGIHDAVRPFVSKKVIDTAFTEIREHDAVVPCISMIPTIRRIDKKGNIGMNRDEFKIIQTPQVFRSDVIKKAYETSYQSHFFDDATVAEYCGYTIKLIDGNEENIKITLPIDYTTAKALKTKTLQYDIPN